MRHFTIPHPLADHAGVYLIRNLDNNRSYIGSTSSPFRVRWSMHLHKLRKGEHRCLLLQYDWDTKSPDRFQFDVLEVLEEPETMRQREQVFINDYYRQRIPLYNTNAACVEMTIPTEDELFAAVYHLLPEPL